MAGGNLNFQTSSLLEAFQKSSKLLRSGIKNTANRERDHLPLLPLHS